MATEEIVLPIMKPETEWVRGRALRKVSPTRNHARLQSKFTIALDAWASGRGEVGTEWRFRIGEPGGPRRPLVPDIAFVAAEKLQGLPDEDIQAPDFPPTVAVEVLLPGEDPRDVASKVDVYLRAGSALVIVIDGSKRTITLNDTTGSPTVLGAADVLCHRALPGFRLRIAAYFSAALDRL
jgi:Uma2 family endonuclease